MVGEVEGILRVVRDTVTIETELREVCKETQRVRAWQAISHALHGIPNS